MDSFLLHTKRNPGDSAAVKREIWLPPAFILASFVLTWTYWAFPLLRRAFGGPILPVLLVFAMTVGAIWFATGLIPRKISMPLRVAVTAGIYVGIWIISEFVEKSNSVLGFFGPAFLFLTLFVCELFGACPA